MTGIKIAKAHQPTACLQAGDWLRKSRGILLRLSRSPGEERPILVCLSKSTSFAVSFYWGCGISEIVTAKPFPLSPSPPPVLIFAAGRPFMLGIRPMLVSVHGRCRHSQCCQLRHPYRADYGPWVSAFLPGASFPLSSPGMIPVRLALAVPETPKLSSAMAALAGAAARKPSVGWLSIVRDAFGFHGRRSSPEKVG